MKKRPLFIVLSLLLVLSLTGTVFGYNFRQPVKLVIPFGAGGSHDIHGRFLASVAHNYLNGQPLLIELRPGGSGTVGSIYVKNAKPDGYTLLFTQNGVHTVMPLIEDLGYSYKDYEIVAHINDDPIILVVAADHPANTFEEFVEWLGKNEKEATWGCTEIMGASSAPAIRTHLAMGFKDPYFRFLTYDGVGDNIRGLLSGEIDFLWQILSPTFVSLREGGEVKILAVTSVEPDSRLPGVPTLLESGYNISSVMWRAILAPKGTPENVLNALESAFANIVKDPSFINLMNTAQEQVRFKGRKEFHDMWMKEIEDNKAVLSEIGFLRDDLDY